MKIYTQDRKGVTEMPRELRVVTPGTAVFVVGCGLSVPVLASYKTEERAKEVVKEIFEYYRNGKNSYIMPLE